jgi:hypothetical protein
MVMGWLRSNSVAGHVETAGIRMRVSATGMNGQTFHTRVKDNGRFKIGHLPAGTYTLRFRPECGDSWTVENIIVRAGESVEPRVENTDKNASQCIVIGMLKIEDDRG